mgnify:CR=1 FL=1
MRILVIAAVLAVSACSPAPEKSADESADKSTEAAAPNNCNASASSSWAAGGETLLYVLLPVIRAYPEARLHVAGPEPDGDWSVLAADGLGRAWDSHRASL